jgi:hypothetical protein
MPFRVASSPKAPTIGSVAYTFVVKPLSVAVLPILPCVRCIEAARNLLASQLPRARMSSATATMWGTNVGHFRSSSPLLTLLTPSPHMT